ncbi:MAG: DUF1080 domain-containing protein [Bryobacter sp.]|nr:DUF1080 domain-containing protein [Bryobacter sp.]
MNRRIFLSTGLAPALSAAPWKQLFDGATLAGWVKEGNANFRAENGAITVDQGTYSWLRTEKAYTNYELEVEFKTAADGNSGIFLRSAAQGKPHETGYELQIFATHPDYPTGSIVGQVRGEKSARFRPNEWNRYQVRHIGKRLVVKLNGKLVLDFTDDKAASGHLGLQFNPNKPISFRKIRVREL